MVLVVVVLQMIFFGDVVVAVSVVVFVDFVVRESVMRPTFTFYLNFLRFSHVVSRIGKLESIDRTYFLITAMDFYHNQVRIV